MFLTQPIMAGEPEERKNKAKRPEDSRKGWLVGFPNKPTLPIFRLIEKDGWQVNRKQAESVGYHQFGGNGVRFPDKCSALSSKISNLYITK